MSTEAELRSRIAVLLRKVPDGVNSGTYQRAVKYKEWYAKAVKQLANPRLSTPNLNNIINQYEGFNR